MADSRCSEAEDEDDEETKEWELAQVRRAGNWEEDAPLKPAKRGYVPAPSKTFSPSLHLRSDGSVPVARPMPTIPPAQARIAKALAEASAAKSEGERALEIAAKDLSLLEEQERDIRKEVERVEAKREWVEEFRIWVEMLGEFLEEKVGQFLIPGLYQSARVFVLTITVPKARGDRGGLPGSSQGARRNGRQATIRGHERRPGPLPRRTCLHRWRG
jgi:hypothetical protein